MDQRSSQVSRRKFFTSSVGLVASGMVLPGCQAGSPAAASTNRQEVPWLPEVQQPRASGDARPALLGRSDGTSIGSAAAWEEQREKTRRRWLDYLGPLEANPDPPVLTVLEEDRPTGVIRQLVEYEGEPGRTVQGYLLKPRVMEEERPGVVVLHSTVDHTIRQPAGVEGNPAKAFGLRLAQMGFVTFCPECFLWRDKGSRDYYEQTDRFRERHPGSKGMAKMLFDARRGLDVLETLEEVDADRLGTIGHSLGAKEVLYLAAFDRRVKAAVSSEGGISTQFSNWEAPWYLGSEIDTFGHDHEELLALVAPRPFLLIGGGAADGAASWPYIEAALPVYELYDQRPSIGFFNHREGHSVPRVAEYRAYQWFLTYI